MDIYVNQGELSAGMLRPAGASLASAAGDLQASISSANGSYGYLGRLIFAGQINELNACLAETQQLKAKLEQYSSLLNSAPRALIEADAEFGDGVGKGLLDIINAIVSIFSGSLFTSNSAGAEATAAEISVDQGTSGGRSKRRSSGAGGTGSTSSAGSADSALGDTNTINQAVAEYEENHPEEAALMDQVLSDPDLTEQERLDIKYTAYNAPEPYRSIYFEHLRQYCVNVGDTDTSYYTPLFNTIYLNKSDHTFGTDPRGAYNTFFHESGHAIDDFERSFGYLSNKYDYHGTSLHDLIVSDTRTYVEDLFERDEILCELTPEDRYIVLRSLNLTDDADYYYYLNPSRKGVIGAFKDFIDPLSSESLELDDPVLESARKRAQKLMFDDLEGEVNEAASDVYGGVTNNALLGVSSSEGEVHYGHRDTNYWYDNKGKATGAQERELWAEFFAAQMTQDEAALESIRRHFPKAYEAMENMAQQMNTN